MKKTNEMQAVSLPEVFTFNPNNAQIRVQVINNEPWFVAKDVCSILGHTNPSVAVQMLDDDERDKKSLGRGNQKLGNDEAWIINESGLYTLILRSNKPEAKRFRKWVTSEVLPAIRKTGKYGRYRSPRSGEFLDSRNGAQSEPTMSSLEIARFTGINHAHLLRDIRKMEKSWEEVHKSKFGFMLKINELPNGGYREVPYYELTQTECLYIMAKFDDRTRAKLVVRWEQLERERLKKSDSDYGKSRLFDTDEPFYHYRTFLRSRGMSLTSGSYWKRMRRYPNEFRTDETGEYYLSGSLARLICKQSGVRDEQKTIKERNPKYLPPAKTDSRQLSLFNEELIMKAIGGIMQVEDTELRVSITENLMEGLGYGSRI